jgi:hypothetical protein
MGKNQPEQQKCFGCFSMPAGAFHMPNNGKASAARCF